MDIILADDHALVREGLRPFLEDISGGSRVLEAENFERALSLSNKSSDLILIILDLAMPGMDGLSGAQHMMEAHPNVPIVILSGTHDQALIMRAFNLGIAGFIPKSAGSELMMNALHLILAGERYMPPALIVGDGELEQPAAETVALDDPPQITESTATARLSARERTVLELLVGGMTNKEIARALDLQEATVKIHVKNIYRKMGVGNRAQAVRTAIQPDWSNSRPQAETASSSRAIN